MIGGCRRRSTPAPASFFGSCISTSRVNTRQSSTIATLNKIIKNNILNRILDYIRKAPGFQRSTTHERAVNVGLNVDTATKAFTVVGDGTQRRDFVYASDVAQAFRLAGETEKSGEIWNLGAGAPQSINRLVELIGGPVVYIPKRPGEPDVTWADVAKITRDLGWKPLIPFEQGVRLMMAEIQNWRDAPLWDPESIKQATKTWFEALGTE